MRSKRNLFFLFFFSPAKSSRKLTFLYLANDVIQNSKRKGPEFTREFESVLVDAFSHVARYVVVLRIYSAFFSRGLHSCYAKFNATVFLNIRGVLKYQEWLNLVSSRDEVQAALHLGLRGGNIYLWGNLSSCEALIDTQTFFACNFCALYFNCCQKI